MKKLFLFLVLGQLLSGLAYAKLNVVATTAEFGAIAKAIGDDKIDITVLARATEDPHFVDAKPSYIVKLSRADAVIEGGAELEIGWLPPLLEGARNSKLAPGSPGYIACNQGVQLLEVPTTLDRSKGDIHAAGNPHYMADPLNAKIIAQHIAQSFCQIDRKNCNAFQANLKKFSDELDARVQQWEKALGPYKGRHLVAYHNSWL